MLKVTFSAFVLLAFAVLGATAAPLDFETGNHFYDQGKFAEAKQNYESLVNNRNFSANLFYNLGNTEFRLGDSGRAILNYERAMVLDPANPEARANLNFVRDKTGAKIPARTWRDSLFPPFGTNACVLAATIAGWIALFCFVAIAFKTSGDRQPLWIAAILALLVCGYALGALRHFEKDASLAIVTAKQTVARYEPADSSTPADTLPMGSRVRIVQDRGPWIYCELPNTNRAWIPSGSLERVRLRSS